MGDDKSGWSPKRVASRGDEIAVVAALRLVGDGGVRDPGVDEMIIANYARRGRGGWARGRGFDSRRLHATRGVCQAPRLFCMPCRTDREGEMLEELQKKISDEAETLLHELNVTLPREIEKAVAQGDLRENSEYTAALERQGFVRAKLDHLARRMSELGEIDVENVPDDRVGFGSRVSVRDIEADEIEDFVLTLADNIDFETNEISMESPIGKALLGKQVGDTTNILLPSGGRELEIVAFKTLHELQDTRESA